MNNPNVSVESNSVSTDLTADELAQKVANKAPAKEQGKSNKIECGRFEGAFKLFARSFYTEVKYYLGNEKVAHKVACDGCASLADAMSKSDEIAAKVNKAKKKNDGEGNFKVPSFKTGDTKLNNAMMLIRLCQQLECLREEKLLCKPLKLTDLSEFLKTEVQDYLDESAAWAERQEWSE